MRVKVGIVACIIAYNEATYLNICLNQIIDYVDKIIIINGSPEGPSTDNTNDVILNQAIKNPGIIIHERGNYGTNNWKNNWDQLQRNAYLKYLEEGDWLWQVDCDEWYLKKDVEKIIELPKTLGPSVACVQFNIRNFIIDHKHIQIKPPGYNDIRFTKYKKNAFYKDNSVFLCYPETAEYAHNVGGVVRDDDIIRFHYSWAGEWEYYKNKLAKFVLRGDVQASFGLQMKDFDSWPDVRKLVKTEEYLGPYPESMEEAIQNGGIL